MTTHDTAAALRRVEAVLERRPDTGLHEDAPAAARWLGGTQVLASHANGMQLRTDMPAELGGQGEHVTPGWLFRAGMASCATTCIVLHASLQGIELQALEVTARSRSDTRGLLGMAGADGEPVSAAAQDVALQVRISARGVAPERLRALVETACRCSPVPQVVCNAVELGLQIDVDEA
ncbi:OsmC family protein [Ideonella sp. BN130291]|uniref:OsmC family protein n=1 Tax=Ideonella sp. BN130291 TaxID=3112940 RepID=UPI002E265FC4|nr:OsmC family protein [Ideonella sp. BN130291]